MPSQSTSRGRMKLGWTTFCLTSNTLLLRPLPTWTPYLVLFLATIPTAYAGSSGDDFSNNLFTDLAPLLALFGDSIVKQYLSQSTNKLDHLIFACGPLGIITSVISAIRVTGATYLMAIIGRARESRAEVELELMSSTSEEVCELWNGHSVVRLLGTPDVLEVIYDPDAGPGTSHGGVYTLDDLKLVHHESPVSDCISLFCWAVCSALSGRFLLQRSYSPNGMPNISLNTAGQQAARVERLTVASVGVVLQLGVLVYEGVITYPLHWEKGDQAVVSYAFPLTAVGTIAISLGMFLCAYVIEKSTEEREYQLKDGERALQVAWLQKKQRVSEQQFGSYAVFAKRGMQSMSTSQLNDVRHYEALTSFAVTFSIVGFVLQFIGLRAMHYSASLGSLIIGVVMTILRTILRRGLTRKPPTSRKPSPTSYAVCQITPGHELDMFAKEVKCCSSWTVIVHITTELTVNDSGSKATDAWRMRMRLGVDAGRQWEGELQAMVTSLAETIQALADHLWNPLGGITTTLEARMLKTLEWYVLAGVRKEAETGKLEMRLSKVNSDGRGPWLAKREEIAAVLCLWMSDFETRENVMSYGWLVARNGDNADIGRGLSDWWISRESSRVDLFIDGDVPESEGRVRGLHINTHLDCTFAMDDYTTASTAAAGMLAKFPDSGTRKRPKLSAETSTVLMTTQYLLSVFVSFAVRWIEPIDSPVEITLVDDKRVLAITNDTVSALADIVQRLGVLTSQDAHRIVVPALARAQKLPRIAIELLELAEHGGRDWPFHGRVKDATYEPRATEFYRLMEVACINEINTLIGLKRWDRAGEILARLEPTFTRILGSTHVRTLSVVEAKCDLSEQIMAVDRADESNPATPPEVLPFAGKFPLHDAVRSKSCTLVYDALKQHHVHINLLDDSGMSPLHLAAVQGTPYIIQLLLLHGACPAAGDDTPTTTPLHLSLSDAHGARTQNRADTTDLLIHSGAAIDTRDGNGDTALTLAATKGFSDCVCSLVLHGAAINAQNDNGDSAVHLATKGGHAAFVKHLVDSHADLNVPDKAGDTPLLIALKLANGDIAKQLFDGGAKIDPIAAAGGGFDVVLKLLTDRMDVTPADLNSALLAAASAGHANNVRVLLENMADIDTRDETSQTPLIRASAGGRTDVARLLLDNGADVHAVDQHRDTPLLLAAQGRHLEVVRVLVDGGADVGAMNKDGSTAMYLARCQGDETMRAVLLRGGAQGGDAGADVETAVV